MRGGGIIRRGIIPYRISSVTFSSNSKLELDYFEPSRRIRGDLIELYKIFAGKYDNNITEWITGKCIEKQHDTRNHRFALQQSHVQYDMRKFNLFPIALSQYGIVYQIIFIFQ